MVELRHQNGQKCVVYLDFKMRFLPKRFREASNLWFGKREISWHGAVVFYGPSEVERAQDMLGTDRTYKVGEKK